MAGEPVPYDSLERICIRAPNWVGDVVMATPALRALRDHFPSARIALIIRRRVEPVLRGGRWFDRQIVYSPDDGRGAREFLRCAKGLRRDRYELGFALPNSFSSALMLRLGRVGRRVGYARDCRSFLLTDAVPRPSEDARFKPTYMVDYYLGLCEGLGIAARGRETELSFGEADTEQAAKILEARGLGPDAGLFLMHPGAGFGPSKRWPAERFARLAELLHHEYDCKVALVAGPGEESTVASIGAASRVPLVDLSDAGIDLHLLKCVVARSRLLVTTDSGPRHYGVALGVPTVCVMGPTHPGYSTSERENDHVVRLDVECGPCQKKVCPRDHRCMADITAEMVLEVCARALSIPERKAGHDQAGEPH